MTPPAWRPIETAPMDGTKFLAYRRGEVATAFRVPWNAGTMWVFGVQCGSEEHWPNVKPTHWMPLPEPPE